MNPANNSGKQVDGEKGEIINTLAGTHRTDLLVAQAEGRAKEAERRMQIAEARSKSLEASERSYRRLFEAARDGILILDIDSGCITDANPYLVELLGHTREEMMGKTVGEISPFKNLVANEGMLKQLQSTGYVHYENLPLETKQGRPIAVEFVSNVYQAGDKKVIQCNIRDITERKAVEEAAGRLAAIVESSEDAIDSEDLNGVVTSWNRGAEKIFGYTTGEMVGNSIGRLIPRQRRGEELELLEQVKRGKSVERFETVRETKARRRIEISVTVSPIRDVGGKVIGISRISRDITSQKRVESELRESEGRYRSLVENAQDAIFTISREGLLTSANPACEALTGLSREDWVGRPFIELVHPGDHARAHEIFQSALAGDPMKPTELRVRARSLEPVVLEFLSTPQMVGGQTVGVLGVGRDISARKKAEASHARLAMAVEQSAETIVITDTAGAIVYANPAFEKTTGYTRAEVLGQNPRILKSGKQDAEFYRQIWEVLGRREVWNGHFINRRKDGVLYEEEATISPVHDPTGAVVNYVAVKRDVTHERQLEAQLRQSQKMEAIGTLAGGVAHDFNNILAIIQLQANLLRLGANLSNEQKSVTDEISATVDRGAALTRQLLLYSRRSVPQLRDLDLNQAASGLTKMLLRILGEDVGLQLKLAGQPMFIHADPGMIDQVIMNLAVNARDAMPNGGQLEIETSAVEFDAAAVERSPEARVGSFACLGVRDNGCGIPAAVLSRIFEPFFTTKDVGKGTGLGLATVFGIVQQHNGWINVSSETGRGTVFQIYLPRLAGNGNPITEKPARSALRGGNEAILVVEDEPLLRTTVRMALSQLGYRIFEAQTGAEALAVWQEHHAAIRLMLTDMVMPDGMSGKALAEQLHQKNPALKVIYMSGYSPEIAGKGFPWKAGTNFLAKPFSVHALAQIIRLNLDAPAGGPVT